MAHLLNDFVVVGTSPPEWSLIGSDITIRQRSAQGYTLHQGGAAQPLTRRTGAPIPLRSLQAAALAAIGRRDGFV